MTAMQTEDPYKTDVQCLGTSTLTSRVQIVRVQHRGKQQADVSRIEAQPQVVPQPRPQLRHLQRKRALTSVEGYACGPLQEDQGFGRVQKTQERSAAEEGEG